MTLDDMAGDYKRSKFLAEQVALEFARDGLPVVIVNPTAPIGDHDVKPTPTGKIVVDFLNGAMPAFIDTGLNVVDVRDTAEGHWLACERGRVGERYILGSENLTLAEILQKLAGITGRKAPTVRLPYAVAYCAGACSTAWARVTGTPPRVPWRRCAWPGRKCGSRTKRRGANWDSTGSGRRRARSRGRVVQRRLATMPGQPQR